MNSNQKFTRGDGLLENFLAKKRSGQANKFITKSYRKGRILDIGCGSYPYFLLNTRFKDKYGIDPSLNLQELKQKGLNLKKINVTTGNLPFKDNYFDTVVMLAVFEHIDADKINFVLKEIKRVLKKGGIFIITTPSPWSDKLLHQMAKLKLISSEEIHEHKTHYKKQVIERLIENSGFEKKKINSGFFEIYMNMWFTAIK